MRLRQVVTTALALALSLVGPAKGLSQQTAEELYQAALYQEEVQGDLQRAIAIYQRILKEHPQSRAMDAQAQLHIGLCYEALGQTEAQRAYQSVIEDYADQADVVAQARTRLAALAPSAVPVKGPVARMLLTSENPADREFQNPKLIVPSPDGRRLAYYQSEPGTEGLYVRDLVSGGSERVTPAQQGVDYGPPAWSADGRRMAYAETDRGTKGAVIRILHLADRTSQVVPGLDARALHVVDWSRDGRYLLCTNEEKSTLELVTAADGSLTTLADTVWPWQQASFSPDGRFVAYGAGPHTHEGLYVQPLAGGPRQRIAEAGGEMYLHPLWSPDGSAIAYQENDGIWVQAMSEGHASGPPRLAYRTDAARWASSWTEAGGLYFTAVNQANIPMEVGVDPRTAQADGSGLRDIEGYPEDMMSFRWSPDRRSVAVNRWGNSITVRSTETGTTRSFDHLEPEGVMILGDEWSPDGKEIWYEKAVPMSGTGGAVKALDVASGAVRELSTALPGRAGVISVSADGRTMAFLRPTPARAVEVVVAPLGQPDGRVVAQINVPGRDPINSVALPRISPRGDQVFYVLQRSGTTEDHPAPDAGSIWVVGTDDGATARQVTTAPFVESARWDPSGRFIAYTARTLDANNTVLRVVEVATGATHDIPMSRTEARVVINDWSKDDRFIGVVRYKNWWEYWAVQGLLEQGGER